MQDKLIFITGGAGFIGSALIRYLHEHTNYQIVNYDALTYAGNLDSLAVISNSTRYHFVRGNINDVNTLHAAIEKFRPTIVMHLAAESHVDRSIEAPTAFLETNILGTFQLLNQCLRYFRSLSNDEKTRFRFHHVSTDEVYGDLQRDEPAFTEQTPYAPSSPYSASKASSDHLVRAWHTTYDLPVVISNCSNNYGPFQFPEKLIPHMILSALGGKTLPLYGDGQQIRDWLYVDDHVEALLAVALQGEIGETYNIGGNCEKSNIEVVNALCECLDSMGLQAQAPYSDFKEQISFVTDRPGHDRRYAIDNKKICRSLGWMPKENFDSGLEKTVHWYLDNTTWWQRVLNGSYQLHRKGLNHATI